jgi:cyclase
VPNLAPRLRLYAPTLTLLALLLSLPRATPAQQPPDPSQYKSRVIQLAPNFYVIELTNPKDDTFHIGVLPGPDGTLIVDHPMPQLADMVRSSLQEITKDPVRALINTHWHYDHVGGNELYGSQALIIAHENVRKRLSVKQTPFWKPEGIGPYAPNAWPRITYRDSLTVYWNGERIDLMHFANAHTDGDSMVFFRNSNVAQVGDVFDGKGHLTAGVDMLGLVQVLDGIIRETNDQTKIVTGHGDISNRAAALEYKQVLADSIEKVRAEIARGDTAGTIAAEGLPEKWKDYPTADEQAGVSDWLREIYRTLTKPDLDR